MVNICLKCSKRFKFEPVDGYIRKYCSPKCASSRINSGPIPNTSWKVKKCRNCLDIFYPKTKQQNYCSNICRAATRIKHLNIDNITWRTGTNFVKSRIRLDKLSGCWNWQDGTFKEGYGKITLYDASASTRTVYKSSHRFVYELIYGKLSSDRVVHHICKNRLCCNPKHLVALTHKAHQALAAPTKFIKLSTTAGAKLIATNDAAYASVSKDKRKLGISWKMGDKHTRLRLVSSKF